MKTWNNRSQKLLIIGLIFFSQNLNFCFIKKFSPRDFGQGYPFANVSFWFSMNNTHKRELWHHANSAPLKGRIAYAIGFPPVLN